MLYKLQSTDPAQSSFSGRMEFKHLSCAQPQHLCLVFVLLTAAKTTFLLLEFPNIAAPRSGLR